MKNKEICLEYKNKEIKLNVKVCNLFEKFKGLMFVKKEKAKILLFNFKKNTKISLHSYFVFFPFIVLWLDDKNKIVDFRLINSFKFFISSKKSFSKIIEIPCNNKYGKIIKLFLS
jgi:uncharacterized membrane protein (UPF0127 family)